MSAPNTELLLRQARAEDQLEAVRSGHRLLVYAAALNLLCLLLRLAGMGYGLLALPGVAALVLSASGLFQVSGGLEYTNRERIMILLTLFVPLLSLVACVWLALLAGGRLDAAGYEVGLFGAGPPPARTILPSASDSAEEPAPAGPVLPCIKTPLFVAAFIGMPGAVAVPVTQRLAGDLIVAFTVDLGHGPLFLTPDECARRNLAREQLLGQARRNAAPAIKALKIKPAGPLFQLVGEGGAHMEACSILFPEFWSAVARRLGDAPLAIFPHRDTVYFTAAGSEAGAAALGEVLATAEFPQPHALSRKIYVFREGKWDLHQA